MKTVANKDRKGKELKEESERTESLKPKIERKELSRN
jgi:hypothetical protein